MAPTLLVLAAGMGSRYGGLKQLEPVGPSGETVLDYGVYDAIRSGFGRAVFVIRREFEDAFRSSVIPRYSGRIGVDFVLQSASDIPDGCSAAGREMPLGTGHAVWCARSAVAGPFAVVNADDFYGAHSYSRIAGFLSAARGTAYAIVGFRLANTLSESGAVSRGVCRERDGRLVSIAEERAITIADIGAGRRFSGSEVVSMNFWGFTPSVFAGLESGLRAFLAEKGTDPSAEFYLPAAVSGLIGTGAASVEVLSCEDAWFGITHRGDRRRVESEVGALVRRGAYPARLFG